MSYYANKLHTLEDIFAAKKLSLAENSINVDGRIYPIIDDVIILLDRSRYTDRVRRALGLEPRPVPASDGAFAEDIQYTFGEEWEKYPDVFPEHEEVFRSYFDLIDIENLHEKRVCDLGCGIGRWSYFLRHGCREFILVDFSDAIFVARKNLQDTDNTLFFMGDLKELPFRRDFCDFLYCLGVLHHLPTNAIDEVRALKRFAPTLVFYLYYALDNRPSYFRILLRWVTKVRKYVSKIRNQSFRAVFTWVIGWFVYAPLIWTGTALRPLGMARHVPLYEGYHGKSMGTIRQDVYDRFFTRIEQRFSRTDIQELNDTFGEVVISNNLPYWHFVCRR